jgi:5'-AMP-activated protein kinase catalytic alpha subunit
MGRYELGELLGKGSFAKVYRALNVETGEDVAIKIMDKDHLAKFGAVQRQVMREIDIMRRVRHPNVVRIQEVMATKRSIFVVMEYVGGGSLDTYLTRCAGRGIGERNARRVFQQLVSALDYCHSLGVFHRDIKPENILVDGSGNINIKVADFGLSTLAEDDRREALLHTVCGTPMFIAPEVFLRCGYDGAKADVWACGVVLYALAAGRYPFNRRDTSLYHMIRRANYHCPSSFSPGLARLVRRLLCPDPARRIALAQIKENLWFKKGFKEIPRSLSEMEERDSDSDDDSIVSLASSEDPSSPVSLEQRCSCSSRMHTSVSAPSLTTLERTGSAAEPPPIRRLKSLNAFDIIASSPSLNLTGLFEDPGEQMRFVSAAPVSKVVSKLEEIAGHVSFTARTKEYQVSIGGNGSKGALLSAKIFVLTPELIMVKVCKKSGDTAEYRQFCDNELKPGLRGLVDGLPEDGGEPIASNSG